ncbi:hypothetical protein [Streptomyces sp. NPDC001530]|uniref:hypothetical protein n=1 Tax=Streptomyces sp. NPDC001530 TaxID=3364582 RepID=UPI0036A90D97
MIPRGHGGRDRPGEATDFAHFTEVAERVDLIPIDAFGDSRTVTLTEAASFAWHCCLPGRRRAPHLLGGEATVDGE